MTSTHTFTSLGQALAFYNYKNPARQRYYDPLEPDRIFGSASHSPDYDPEGIFASVTLAIRATLLHYDHEARNIWNLRNKGDKSEHLDQWSIARRLCISQAKVSRILKRINEDLTRELIRRELLPPIEH